MDSSYRLLYSCNIGSYELLAYIFHVVILCFKLVIVLFAFLLKISQFDAKLNIQSVPKRSIHKVNIPYYDVHTSSWGTSICVI